MYINEISSLAKIFLENVESSQVEVQYDFKFKNGWKSKDKVKLFGKSYDIVINILSDSEKDPINDKQSEVFSKWMTSKGSILSDVEKLLKESKYSKTFVPKTLSISKVGRCLLLSEPNSDIVISLYPERKVLLNSKE